MGSSPISREARRPYYRVFVPLLSADNDVSSEKLEGLVDCKGRTLSDEELANLKAAQVFIKSIMPYLPVSKNSTVHIIQEYKGLFRTSRRTHCAPIRKALCETYVGLEWPVYCACRVEHVNNDTLRGQNAK